jgi:hypothetical protein
VSKVVPQREAHSLAALLTREVGRRKKCKTAKCKIWDLESGASATRATACANLFGFVLCDCALLVRLRLCMLQRFKIVLCDVRLDHSTIRAELRHDSVSVC